MKKEKAGENVQSKKADENRLKRDGNFEVLRILCAVLIIFHHYAVYGGIADRFDVASLTNVYIGRFLAIGGRIAVSIFLIIMGYFLINSKFKIRRFLKIFFEWWFYAILVEAFWVFVWKEDRVIKNFFRTYWFVHAYMAVYLISPFLNKAIKMFTKKQLLLLILVLLYIMQFFASSNFGWAVYMYIIGAYIKLHNVELKEPKKAKWYALTLYILIFASMPIITYLQNNGFDKYFAYFGFGLNYTKFSELQNFVALATAIMIFMTFKYMNIKNNRVINFFSRASLASYLIHDSDQNRFLLWFKLLKVQEYYTATPLGLIGNAVFCMVAIYLFSALVETIRLNLVEKPMFKIKIFDKYLDKFDEMMNF